MDAIADHGRTTALDRKLRALEQERHDVEQRLAAANDDRLASLPDALPGVLERYRAKVAALAKKPTGLTAQQTAQARELIDELLGGPIRVDATLTARLELACAVVAGAGFEPATFGL